MQVSFSDTLVTQECVTCGITFGLTATVVQQLRTSLRSFTCPNGHSQSYKGVLETERLQQRIQELEHKSERDEQRIVASRREQVRLARRIFALQGVITKMKRRAVVS